MNRGTQAGVHAGARWGAFVLMSLAVHAAFVLTSASRGTPHVDVDVPFAAGKLDVALFPAVVPAPTREAVESEWKALEPLPQNKVQGMRRARMLDFAPVDVVSKEIDESAYLPLSRVTLRPSPIVPIAVPFPTGVASKASSTAKIVVFIDEDGSVAKVAFAKDQMATPFALAAARTFERARYRPALVDGAPVKVRVTLVVTFEDREAKPSNGMPRG